MLIEYGPGNIAKIKRLRQKKKWHEDVDCGKIAPEHER